MFNASRNLATSISRRITARGRPVLTMQSPSLTSSAPFVSARSATTNRVTQPVQVSLFSSVVGGDRGPLEEFRDPVTMQARAAEPVGRSWSVKELRRKSYDDLHKLWYVLYKEKNMLLTERQLSRRRQVRFPQPERFKKVQKSMQAIKQVLGERKRSAIAAYQDKKLPQLDKEAAATQMMDEADDDDDVEIVVK